MEVRFPVDDGDCYHHTITSVEKQDSGWVIGADHFCFLVPDKGVVPKIGDLATFYGPRWGPVRGLFINGKKVFYKTEDEYQRDFKAKLEKDKQDRYQHFIDHKDERDLEFDTLPREMQIMIERLRKNDSEFRYGPMGEDYTMFALKQALVIADALKTPEVVEKFMAMKDFKEQMALVPGLDDGHSGNTFAFACHWAYWWLKDKSIFTKEEDIEG